MVYPTTSTDRAMSAGRAARRVGGQDGRTFIFVFAMVMIGCLALVIFPILGLAAGGLLDGPGGARLGAGIGFLLALALAGVGSLALWKARSRP